MKVELISDPGDSRVNLFRNLNDIPFRKRFEGEQGIFVAEGLAAAERVVAAGLGRSMLIDVRHQDRLDERWEIPILVAECPVIDQIVGFRMHRGCVAVGNRLPFRDLPFLKDAAVVGVFEGVSDHENLGALIRTSAALGVDAVLMDPTTADPWYRRSVRVSMGAVSLVPMVRSPDLSESLRRLKEFGFQVVGLSPSGSIPIGSWVPGRKTALLVGSEGPGLTDGALCCCDKEISIPMERGIDSLNVGHAYAIALHWVLNVGGESDS